MWFAKVGILIDELRKSPRLDGAVFGLLSLPPPWCRGRISAESREHMSTMRSNELERLEHRHQTAAVDCHVLNDVTSEP